jgi:hypothetical protein
VYAGNGDAETLKFRTGAPPDARPDVRGDGRRAGVVVEVEKTQDWKTQDSRFKTQYGYAPKNAVRFKTMEEGC